MRTASFYAVLLLVFSIPAMTFDVPGISGSANRLLGIGVVLVWLVSILSEHRVRKIRIFHIAVLMFVLINLLSVYWSIEPSDSLDRAQRLLQSFLMVVMVWDLCRTREQVTAARQAFIFGCYVLALWTILNFLHGVNGDDEHRFAAAGFEPDDVGFILSLGIPFAWSLAISKWERSPVRRALNYLYPAAALFTIIISGTRGALLASLPGLLYIMLTMKYASSGWRATSWIATIVVVILISGMRNGPIQRFATIVGSASNDHFTGRTDIWLAGLEIYQQHPILGIGGGAFPDAVVPFHIKQAAIYNYRIVAHNTFLSVLTELGLVGFILFVGLLGLLLREILQQERSERSCSLYTFLVWVVAVSSLTCEYRPQTWLVFALILIGGHYLENNPPETYASLAITRIGGKGDKTINPSQCLA